MYFNCLCIDVHQESHSALQAARSLFKPVEPARRHVITIDGKVQMWPDAKYGAVHVVVWALLKCTGW